MQRLPDVRVHESCWPQADVRDLVHSLRTRRIRHKFHYQSHKQARRWLALHEAFSPARQDPACRDLYRQALTETAADWPRESVHLVGLGCGGGQKEVLLLEALTERGLRVAFTPQDASLPLVITAWERAMGLSAFDHADQPAPEALLCDVASVTDPEGLLATMGGEPLPRLVTFFGMAPNFEPTEAWPELRGWMGEQGRLLLSANLAPGPDYRAGVEQVLPSYDNTLTNDWLSLFLLDLGLEAGDGGIGWSIEPCPYGTGLLRIAADYHPCRERSLDVEGVTARFEPGQPWRLFFSYRHTPDLLAAELARHGLCLRRQWITPSGQEGVFLCDLE